MSAEIVGLGLFIGLVLAITGAGGAILSIPLLVFFLHLDLSQAAPIGLFALALSAGFGALLGLKTGHVRYKAASLMAILGMCMAPTGVWLSHILPASLVGVLFALLLAYVALRMWQGSITESTYNPDAKTPACQLNPVTSRLYWTAPCTARLGLAGGTAGLLSGLLGVGGGFVIVPSLRKVSNFDQRTIIATSLAVIALVSIASFVTYGLHSAVNWQIAWLFGISTLAGSLIGRQFAAKIPQHTSQRIFAALAMIIALALLIKYLMR